MAASARSADGKRQTSLCIACDEEDDDDDDDASLLIYIQLVMNA